MALVAQIYTLPPRVLPSIQRVEGGAPGLAHPNVCGTEDLGVMQINTIWLSYLSSYTHLPAVEVRVRLLGRACFNIAAAGLIMRVYPDETGGDLMRAVGNYHSHTLALNLTIRPAFGARPRACSPHEASFRFVALDPAGRTTRGAMEAASEAEVVSLLQRQGSIPLRAEPAASAWRRVLDREIGRRGMSRQEVANFTRELAVMLSAGQDLDRSPARCPNIPPVFRGSTSAWSAPARPAARSRQRWSGWRRCWNASAACRPRSRRR